MTLAVLFFKTYHQPAAYTESYMVVNLPPNADFDDDPAQFAAWLLDCLQTHNSKVAHDKGWHEVDTKSILLSMFRL